jgi:hypothetical protein
VDRCFLYWVDVSVRFVLTVIVGLVCGSYDGYDGCV